MLPPIYHTKRCTLKAYSKQDENRFVEISMNKQSVQFMGGASGIEQEERELFQKIIKIYDSNNPRWFWIWGIYLDGKLAGHLELKETKHTDDKELEVVYMIHPESRRQGIMKEVLLHLIGLQEDWNRRIIATVAKDNFPSISLLEKVGFGQKEEAEDEESEEGYWKMKWEKSSI